MDSILYGAAWAAAAAASHTGAAYLGQHQTLAAVLSDAPHPAHPRRLADIAQRVIEAQNTPAIGLVTAFPRMSFRGVQVLDTLAKGASTMAALTFAKSLPQTRIATLYH